MISIWWLADWNHAKARDWAAAALRLHVKSTSDLHNKDISLCFVKHHGDNCQTRRQRTESCCHSHYCRCRPRRISFLHAVPCQRSHRRRAPVVSDSDQPDAHRSQSFRGSASIRRRCSRPTVQNVHDLNLLTEQTDQWKDTVTAGLCQAGHDPTYCEWHRILQVVILYIT